MSEPIEKSYSEIMNSFADAYHKKKGESIINIIQCGKILYDARHTLSHGTWGTFLEDHRVNENIRTAQRLITIYENFRHLLDVDSSKIDALSHLGVTALLELQKLPERFKKEVEIITTSSDGSQVTEKTKVIDEEKLVDFLDTIVEVDGQAKKLSELPIIQMRKYINEIQGVYEPDNWEDDKAPELPAESYVNIKESETPTEKYVNPIEVVVQQMALLHSSLQIVLQEMDNIQEDTLYLASEDSKAQLSKYSKQIYDSYATLHLKLDSMILKLR